MGTEVPIFIGQAAVPPPRARLAADAAHLAFHGRDLLSVVGHATCWKLRWVEERTTGGASELRGTKMREVVLYVEDHPVNVLLMQTVFELRPELDLVVAVDGESAMAAAANLRPSLLLLDLRLPDCHGTELLERMRVIPGWRDIPAIAVTAEAEFMPTGTTFCDVWHKPLRVPTLLTRLDRVLAPKGRSDDVATQRRVSMFSRTTFAT
jgi:CheY-like chemotaxis protein